MGFFKKTLGVSMSAKDIGSWVERDRGRIDQWFVAAANVDAAPAQRVAEILAQAGSKATRL